MLKNIVVDVASRPEAGKNESRRLRHAGRIPAVLYGERKPAVKLTVDPKEIGVILASEGGSNTLFQLRLDGQEGKTRHVMIREPQIDPVTGALIHVDFFRIDTARPVEVEVPIQILGVATGVKNDGGILEFVDRSVQLFCLPTDIPEHLEIDVTEMKIGDVRRVKDLEIGEGIELRSEPEAPLVVISSPRALEAEEEAAAVEGEEAEEVPEGAEGEEKPAAEEEESK